MSEKKSNYKTMLNVSDHIEVAGYSWGWNQSTDWAIHLLTTPSQ